MIYRVRRQCRCERVSEEWSGKLDREKKRIIRKLWTEKKKAKQKIAGLDVVVIGCDKSQMVDYGTVCKDSCIVNV